MISKQDTSLSLTTFIKLALVLLVVTGCASYHTPEDRKSDMEEARSFR